MEDPAVGASQDVAAGQEDAALSGWLRRRDDDTLRAILRDRPELITPVPSDMATLAARASTQGAVARVLDTLDTFTLTVVEVLLVLPAPVSYDELADGLGGSADNGESIAARLRGAVDRLRELLLIWGDDDALWPVPALHHLVTHPVGLGPPAAEAFASYPPERLADLATDLALPSTTTTNSGASTSGDASVNGDASVSGGAAGGGRDMALEIAGALGDPDWLARVLGDVGPEARQALERLAWGPPVGSVSGARRAVRVATAASPIESLLARGLLAASGERSVVLPREVALYLRGGRLIREPVGGPPALDGRAHDPAMIDRMAAGEAFALVRGVEDLLELWGVTAPGVLRSGGLGVRDLRRAAEELDVPEWVAALYAELAYAAGLLAVSETVDGEWLPTVAYDLWRGRDLADRWTELARTWLATTRVPGLVGERDDRDRAYNALGDGLDRGGAPDARDRALRALAAAEPGTAPGADDVRAVLDWWQPRRKGRFRDLMTDTALREAERLGFTGRGALAGYARALLDGDAAEAERGLAEVLPEPVDHVLVQADLTAVAPGPLTPELARELALTADIESTGGATVYRFSESSVRRALDAGRSAEELTAFLERRSRTPVPQPLRYLIADVARRHGRLRVGTASAYVRCDDPATLDELLADRHTAPLRLHRIAPTVLISRAARGAVLDTIRAAGFAPMGESFEGDVVISRPDARRAPDRQRSQPVRDGRRRTDDTTLTAAVRAIRAGDEAATALRRPITAPGDEPPRSAAAATIAALGQAVAAGRRVWIGYLDAQGQASSRIVEPARVEGGYLTAYDATRAAIHRFSLHRITGVAAIDEAGVAAETP